MSQEETFKQIAQLEAEVEVLMSLAAGALMKCRELRSKMSTGVSTLVSPSRGMEDMQAKRLEKLQRSIAKRKQKSLMG